MQTTTSKGYPVFSSLQAAERAGFHWFDTNHDDPSMPRYIVRKTIRPGVMALGFAEE